MPRKASNFKIGLFVTAGALICLAAIVWLGATKYFQKASTYVTYFSESVQGLQPDSSVKYLGVDVGRVDKIRVAPDYRLIEVVMKIDFQGDLSGVVAQLKMAGITGIVFVELDRRAPDEPDLSPRLDFTPPYPVIASRPSQLTQIFAVIDEMVRVIRQVDFKGISEQIKSSVGLTESLVKQLQGMLNDADLKGISDKVKATLGAGEDLLRGERLGSILARLESTATNLERASGRVDKALEEAKFKEVILEAKATVSEARGLISDMRGQLEAMNLAETVGHANRLLEGVDRRTRAVAVEMTATSENLRRASETLDLILERLSTSPSDLIFGQPPPPARR